MLQEVSLQMTLCSGVLNCMTNQMEGKLSPKCGSLAKIGLPEYDLLPETAQLLLPLSGCGLSIVSEYRI